MTYLPRVLGILALVVCIAKPVHAGNQPWCIYKNYGDGYADCRYATLQQCLADRLGTGGSCGLSYADCRYATLQQCLADRLGTGGSCGLNPYPSSPEPQTRSPRRS